MATPPSLPSLPLAAYPITDLLTKLTLYFRDFRNELSSLCELYVPSELAENASLEEWKERPSQYEVPRSELVAKVREILDLHS